VEDEPPACLLLQNYVHKSKVLDLKAVFNSAEDAMAFLKHQRVDLIFSDIHLPGTSGMNMLKMLGTNPPKIVITSAYEQYGAEAYNLDVVDYLVKPFSYERFLRAIQKTHLAENTPSMASQPLNLEQEFVFFKADKKLHKILLNDIVYFQSLGNYIKLQMISSNLIFRETLWSVEKRLPSQNFFRVHKSYIVNILHINFIHTSQNSISTKCGIVPIGEAFKELFFSKIHHSLLFK
jgi:DNA-binding LytR/AlgR family response regulator